MGRLMRLAWLPAFSPACRHLSVKVSGPQAGRACFLEDNRRTHRRETLCHGMKGENALSEQLKLAILREDYDLAAKIRDELAQERGVDVHQLKRQLESAIAWEDYSEAARLRDQLKAAGANPASGDERTEVTYTSTLETRSIRVTATSAFVPQRSSPEKKSFFFVYEIKIENMGSNTVQLRSRCWNITDANGKLHKVRGPGVVGKYPILGPGTSFSYQSACPIATPTGVMEGSYDFLLLDCGEEEVKGVPLKVDVAPFLLSTLVVGNINIDDK